MAENIWQTWGIGMIVVTVSAFGPILGILVVPLFQKKLYERIMSTLIAVGVGALSGSIMYIMLPQAMNVTDDNVFLVRSSIILAALYFFFLVDRFIEYMMEFRKMINGRKIHLTTLNKLFATIPRLGQRTTYQIPIPIICSDEDGIVFESEVASIAADLQLSEVNNAVRRRFSTRNDLPILQAFISRSNSHSRTSNTMSRKSSNASAIISSSNQLQVPRVGNINDDDVVSVKVSIVEEMVPHEGLKVATVAYMIIFGSASNNFVDGMSNGVAFSSSLIKGLSIGIACIAQQFPQELGLLAILSKSGLGLKRAILLDLIPAAMSYLGFIIGALLEKSFSNATGYVFALSSGMYLYILLGCLVSIWRFWSKIYNINATVSCLYGIR